MTAPAQRDPTGGLGELLYTLDEVAAATKLSRRALEVACRKGIIACERWKGLRGIRMTRPQIDALIANGLHEAPNPERSRAEVEAAEREIARTASLRNASRATTRARVTA